MSNVVDPVAQHHQTREPQPEREAAPLLGIDAAGPQNVLVDEAAGQQLDPRRALADAAAGAAERAARIELEARLDEREVARSQPDLDLLLEDSAQQGLHGADQVAHRDLAVHDHPLHLVEGVVVARVGGLLPEALARSDHAKGRLELLHGSHLDR